MAAIVANAEAGNAYMSTQAFLRWVHATQLGFKSPSQLVALPL